MNLEPFWIGIISAISLPLGAISAFYWNPNQKFIAGLMAFGAGSLLAALTLDLVGVAISKGDLLPLIIGAIIGGIFFVFLNDILENYGGYKRKISTALHFHSSKILDMQINKTKIEPTISVNTASIAIWLGILLDGIPESLVLGINMIGTNTIELSLIAGLFLSNYPEALSSSRGMLDTGLSKTKIFMMWFSIMLFTGFGAMIGHMFLQHVEHYWFSFIEGLAAGAMLTMIAQTMLPEAYHKGGNITGIATLMGFLVTISLKGEWI